MVKRKLRFKCPYCGGNDLREHVSNISTYGSAVLVEDCGDLYVNVKNEVPIYDKATFTYGCGKCGWKPEVQGGSDMIKYLKKMGAVK